MKIEEIGKQNREKIFGRVRDTHRLSWFIASENPEAKPGVLPPQENVLLLEVWNCKINKAPSIFLHQYHQPAQVTSLSTTMLLAIWNNSLNIIPCSMDYSKSHALSLS